MKTINGANSLAEGDSPDNYFTTNLPYYQMDDDAFSEEFGPELIKVLEASVAKNELKRMVGVIRKLSTYLQSIPDEIQHMDHAEKRILLRQADCILAIYDN